MTEKSTDKTIGQRIVEFFNLAKENPGAVATFLDEQDALRKATPHADGVLEDVKDGYRAGHKHAVPTKEEIKTGPTFGARGGSPEAMNTEYSRNAAQMGVQEVAERFGDMIGKMTATVKAGFDAQNAKFDTLTELLTKKAKDGEEEEEDDEEEESEVVEINEKSAVKLIATAKKLLAKADELMEQSDEATDVATEKSLLKQAKALRKKAGRILGRARSKAYACGVKGKELRKSIRIIAKKADINVVQEEEEEEEEDEESEKSKTAKVVPTAKGEDKGNQADKKDEETGNQDDSAKKAAPPTPSPTDPKLLADVEQIKAALAGNATLVATVSQLMDLVRGQPQPGGPRPADFSLLKGDPAQVDVIIQKRIEEAAAGGVLSHLELMSAQNIAGKLDAMRSGAVPEAMVKSMIANAPSNVKSIFRDAA